MRTWRSACECVYVCDQLVITSSMIMIVMMVTLLIIVIMLITAMIRGLADSAHAPPAIGSQYLIFI